MIRSVSRLAAVACLLLCSSLPAQSLIDTPEGIAFDSAHNRYLVSCYGTGKVVAVDTSGVESVFAQGLSHCLGNQMVGDTLFVSAGTHVVGLDLESGDVVWAWTAPIGSGVDGLAADTSGFLYVTSPGLRTIYRVDIASGTSDVLATGLPPSPQDITYDKYHNRLLACSYSLNGPITAVSLPGGALTTAATCPYGYHDGITHDDRGNTYVGCAKAGIVLMWDSTFTDPPMVVASGSFWIAGLDYNVRDDVIAVPDFYGNRMLLFEVFRPKLAAYANSLSEVTGDGDGHADTGETVSLSVTVKNDGWAATGITSELIALNSYITVTSAVAQFPDMPGDGATATSLTPFILTVDAACPDPYIARLQLTLSAAGEFTFVDTLLLFSGDTYGFSDDVEAGEGLWTHGAPNGRYVRQWHLETYRQHSGAVAWKTGGIGSEPYSDSSDSRLVTPPFLLQNHSTLSFWHWIDANAGDEPGMAWDGAAVYISTGDGAWTQLTPTGGYPCTLYDNPESPFEAGTSCYSGSHDWAEAAFDLAGYSGVVQLMFRFGSDGANTGEGWYIDDVSVLRLSCCGIYTGGFTGNVDCDIQGKINLADITVLIDHVYISRNPLCCTENGNVDGDSQAKINLADITAAIDHVYISREATALCQ